jgi:hypothetical protein
MSRRAAELVRYVLSATPFILIASADAFFFSVLGDHARLPAAGYLIQMLILAIAALIAVPDRVLRLTCTILLSIAALLGSMTIGIFYLPAVGAAALLTTHQFKVDRQIISHR